MDKKNNSCPMCRTTLKEPFSVQKIMKIILYNPGFWWMLLSIFFTIKLLNEQFEMIVLVHGEFKKTIVNKCPMFEQHCTYDLIMGSSLIFLSILMFCFWHRSPNILSQFLEYFH